MPQLQAWQMWSRRPVEEVSATLVALLQKNLWIKDFLCHSFDTILRMFLNQMKFDNGLWKFSNIISRLQISKGFFYSSSNHWKKARGLSAIKIKPAILVLCFVQQQNPPEDQSALCSVHYAVFSVHYEVFRLTVCTHSKIPQTIVLSDTSKLSSGRPTISKNEELNCNLLAVVSCQFFSFSKKIVTPSLWHILR